jgi:hypothetical protein
MLNQIEVVNIINLVWNIVGNPDKLYVFGIKKLIKIRHIIGQGDNGQV